MICWGLTITFVFQMILENSMVYIAVQKHSFIYSPGKFQQSLLPDTQLETCNVFEQRYLILCNYILGRGIQEMTKSIIIMQRREYIGRV